MTFLQKLRSLLNFEETDPISPLPASRRLSETGFSNGPYELCIPQGLPRPTGHVLISHRQQYSVLLKNRSDLRCDAKVSVDGKIVGSWRIPAQGQAEIERPANDTGQFTFYMLGTKEARQIGLSKSDALGLVSATFMPELPPVRVVYNPDTAIQFSPRVGGTGLSGESSQKFKTVSALKYDHEHFVTIHARLYCDDGSPRPLKSANSSIPTPLP